MIKLKIKQHIKKLLARTNYCLHSRRNFDKLVATRDFYLQQLVDANKLTCRLEKGATGIVFSLDRAFQLYVLLESYIKNCYSPPRLIIIYRASNEAHKTAYKNLMSCFDRHKDLFQFVEENLNFSDVVYDIINNVPTQNIFFIVDDNIVIRRFDGGIISSLDTNKYILSLRLSPYCTFSYTSSEVHTPPDFRVSKFFNGLEFDWFNGPNEWSYPYSLDGHVFSTHEIRMMISNHDFRAPNSLEELLMLHSSFATRKAGLCFKESVLLNLPLNKVQNENSNISAGISPDFYLQQWNNGMTFDWACLQNHIPVSPHEEHSLKFTRRLPLNSTI